MIPVSEPIFAGEQDNEMASDVSTEIVSFQQTSCISQPNIPQESNIKVISDGDSYHTAQQGIPYKAPNTP
ncbi:Hypothetical predicted protein [Octopus vulgaris]|uniref:Uncharacterized protein n=1 Tax=Octopus vulgaris TaxID=6645 RepID=A0AA36BTW3_OCTVU|nr:Hypothetical predicted protein [Octopus vulgaris]